MSVPLSQPPEEIREIQQLREQTLVKIRRLESRSYHGLYAIALFLAISTIAGRGFDLLPKLPEPVWEALGAPPSPGMVSLALIVYTFSAIILILSKMTLGQESPSVFAHVGYLTGFYIFFHLADGRIENFWAVFAAGVTVLGLCSFHRWNQCTEMIRQEKEILATLERRERFFDGRAAERQPGGG